MKMLFVDACPRKETSRTRQIAQVFLNEVRALYPDVELIIHDLSAMHLRPFDAEMLFKRESCCEKRNWEHPLTQYAHEFQQADYVVIAAPYWDLSFPAELKIWVEHMWVRNLTFRYEADQPIGLCKGNVCVYLTTAGSPVLGTHMGIEYISTVMKTLGIPGFRAIRAEGLDIANANVEKILSEAEEKAKAAARDMDNDE